MVYHLGYALLKFIPTPQIKLNHQAIKEVIRHGQCTYGACPCLLAVPSEQMGTRS